MSARLLIKIGTCLVLCILVLSPSIALAHRSGCHRWHSCPSDSGSYSCGDWGYSNYCPTQTPTYTAPITTTKDFITVQKIPRGVAYQDNENEYPTYRKTIKEGMDGERSSKIVVTYTDGIETSRTEPSSTITHQPISKVVEKGSRIVPLGFIDSVEKVKDGGWFGWNRGKFIVTVRYRENTKIVLTKNDNIIDTGTTDKNGEYVFSNISLSDKDSISIGTNDGRDWFWQAPKSTRVSEKCVFDKDDTTLTTEYAILHSKK